MDIKKAKKNSERQNSNAFDIFCEDRPEILSNEIQRLYESIRLMEMLEKMRTNEFRSNYRSIIDDFPIEEQISKSCKIYLPKYLQKINKRDEKNNLYYDIRQDDVKLTITVHMPDIKREEIEFNFNRNSLEIMPNNPGSQYYTFIKLPCEIREKAVVFTYKNGILDIVFEKKKEG